MFDLVTWPRNLWSILDEMDSLQTDMGSAFSGWVPSFAGDAEGRRGRAWRRRRPAYPLINVWSSADGVVIDAELPGVDPKDVDISVKGDELTLRGKVNSAEAAEGETYLRRERPAGDFVRALQLPFRADPAAVKANYRNGILRLTVPRAEEDRPRRIAIEAA